MDSFEQNRLRKNTPVEGIQDNRYSSNAVILFLRESQRWMIIHGTVARSELFV